MRVNTYDLDGNYIRSYMHGMFDKCSRSECIMYLQRLIVSSSGKDIRTILDVNHVSYSDPRGDWKYTESGEIISFYLNGNGSLAYIGLDDFAHQNITKVNSWEDLYKAICSFIYSECDNSDSEVRHFTRSVINNLVSFYRSWGVALEVQSKGMSYGDLSHLSFDYYSYNGEMRSLKGYMVGTMKMYFRDLFGIYGVKRSEDVSIRRIPERFWIEKFYPNIKFSDGDSCNFCYINDEIYYL